MGLLISKLNLLKAHGTHLIDDVKSLYSRASDLIGDCRVHLADMSVNGKSAILQVGVWKFMEASSLDLGQKGPKWLGRIHLEFLKRNQWAMPALSLMIDFLEGGLGLTAPVGDFLIDLVWGPCLVRSWESLHIGSLLVAPGLLGRSWAASGPLVGPPGLLFGPLGLS